MDNVFSFLEAQMRTNLELDAVEGLIERERSGSDRPGLRKNIYQNTLNWIKQEANDTLQLEFNKLHRAELNEETLQTDITTFTTSLMPAVRRIYNRLIAMDLVSVQPMNGPTGLIHYIDHMFGTSGGGATSGQRLDKYRYDDYANSSEGGDIREVNFKIKAKTITAVTKKIQGKWSIEAEQDLKSQHNINLEAELMGKMVTEIVRETDGQLIADLEGGVANNVNWNMNGYRVADASTAERKAYDETLKDAIIEANNEIYKLKYMNAGWIICDADAYLRLQKLEAYNVDPLIVNNEGFFGRRYVGTLSAGSLMRVYVDPDFTANKFLLGLKGNTWDVAVGYYAPYIPLFTSSKYIQGDDFTQFLKGAMTRYAHGIIPEEYTASTVNNGLASVSLTSS